MQKFSIVLFVFFGLSSSVFAGDASSIGVAASALVAGILLTFTPCVLPMVPIVSGIIVGEGEHVTKTRALLLTLSYILGTALTYAIMGALAGATGEQLQSYFQNVWVIGTFSIVFVLMALSMFGLFTIALPSFMQTKLNANLTEMKGGKLGMVFLLGAVSALILGACVSPVLISFLSVAISSSDPVLGAITMFFLALGMGVPLIFIGIGAGYFLPKAGEWMDQIKYLFGILLLGVAIEIFSTVALVNILLIWGVYGVAIGVYFGATQPLEKESNGWKIFQKAVGTVSLIWGTILMVGGAYGETNVWQPLPKTSVIVEGTKPKLSGAMPFEELRNFTAYEIYRRQAMDQNKTMLIYFHTDTCPVCKHLRDTTFSDQKVQEKLAKDYIAVSVNMTDKKNPKIEELKEMFQVFGPPGFVFIGADGKEMKDEKFYGYQEPEEFYNTLDLLSE
ncbi:MAG: hypothetical protein RL113_318 [Pseudomonadota bacterium]